jgi:predicted Zn-dependent protease with MMP-like domain
MKLSEFEKIVNTATESIPLKFKTILKKEGIHLLARAKAPPAARGRTDTLIFGMFIGTPYTERSVSSTHSEPTRIELYMDSFEIAFDDTQEITHQITLTVIHEIGHYFGFSAKELRKYLE